MAKPCARSVVLFCEARRGTWVPDITLVVVAGWLGLASGGWVSAADVILDNGGPGTSADLTWVLQSATSAYGGNYVYRRTNGSYTYMPSLAPGRYNVHMWWPIKGDAAKLVPITVQAHQGPVTVVVNQTINGGKWNLLGTFELDPTARVVVNGASGLVMADAVRFEPNPPADAPPSAPTGLTASASGSSILLDWNDNPEGDLGGYSVYRAEVPGGSYQAVASEIAGSSYTDDRIRSGATYSYVVIASDLNGGLSLSSAVATATSLAVPTTVVDNGAPGIVMVGGWSKFSGQSCYGPFYYMRSSNGSYTFNVPLTPGSYRVFVWWAAKSTLATSVPITTQTTSGPVSRTVDQSRNGGRWNLIDIFPLDSSASVRLDVISAKYVCADAVRFELVSGGAPPDPPPSAPAGLTAAAQVGAIHLDWSDNPEADLASYSVYRSTTSGSGFAALASGLTSSVYDDLAVAVGTTYYYMVFAVDAAGQVSAGSAQVSAQPLAPPPTQSVSLTWNAPILNQDGTPLIDLAGYKLYRGTQPGVYGTVTDLHIATQATVNLATGNYYFRLTAYDTSGNESTFSNEISYVMP
jgi:fibronectin type 3 domain-containing protein